MYIWATLVKTFVKINLKIAQSGHTATYKQINVQKKSERLAWSISLCGKDRSFFALNKKYLENILNLVILSDRWILNCFVNLTYISVYVHARYVYLNYYMRCSNEMLETSELHDSKLANSNFYFSCVKTQKLLTV